MHDAGSKLIEGFAEHPDRVIPPLMIGCIALLAKTQYADSMDTGFQGGTGTGFDNTKAIRAVANAIEELGEGIGNIGIKMPNLNLWGMFKQ